MQDEATAVWARVVATFQQHVYVGALPRSHRSVVAVPSSGRVVLDLVDHVSLPAFKRAVTRAHRPHRPQRTDQGEDGVRTRVEVLRVVEGVGASALDSDSEDEGEGQEETKGDDAKPGVAGAASGTSTSTPSRPPTTLHRALSWYLILVLPPPVLLSSTAYVRVVFIQCTPRIVSPPLPPPLPPPRACDLQVWVPPTSWPRTPPRAELSLPHPRPGTTQRRRLGRYERRTLQTRCCR
jgi:hypothetical protein